MTVSLVPVYLQRVFILIVLTEDVRRVSFSPSLIFYFLWASDPFMLHQQTIHLFLFFDHQEQKQH